MCMHMGMTRMVMVFSINPYPIERSVAPLCLLGKLSGIQSTVAIDVTSLKLLRLPFIMVALARKLRINRKLSDQ